MVGRLGRAGFRLGLVQPAVATKPVVFDYSIARFDPAELLAANVVGVCRYLSAGAPGTFNDLKRIRQPEYDQLINGGISITLNWELSKDRWRSGYAGGLVDGAEARRQARALSHPDHRQIVQSVDTNWSGLGDLMIAVAYQSGFDDGGGCGPQALYGTSSMIDAMFDLGHILWGWRTGSTAWTGNGYMSTHAAMFQRTTKSFPQFPPSSYDENDILMADHGQWPLSADPPPPVGGSEDCCCCA